MATCDRRSPEGVEGRAHAQPEVVQYPPNWAFHRKLATGSDVIFPRICCISSTKCWLVCSLRRPRLPLSLVICPFYFHNYI